MAKKDSGITFSQLLATAGAGDAEELEKEREALAQKLEALMAEVNKIKQEVKEVDSKLQEPIKKAVASAKLLGVLIPEKYANTKPAKSTDSNGLRYEFSTNGRVPVTYSLSEAAWYYTSGCGGANKEGRFNVEELRDYIEKNTGTNPATMELQDKVTFTLPNEKEYTMMRTQ